MEGSVGAEDSEGVESVEGSVISEGLEFSGDSRIAEGSVFSEGLESICRNSCSVTMGMLSFWAFWSFDGPMFSPARTNDVFALMEPTFFPPCCSMMALYSSRLC